jgi:2-dehydropantoate 2-reductase
MKIAIIGTGGVGGYFGGKLANAGYNVGFLARGEHLQALQTNGLTVKSVLGDFHINNVRASNTISNLGKSDLIILGVKAWQILEVRHDLKSILHDETAIIPLQNGVLAAEELAEVITRKHILGGMCRIMTKVESPGVILHSEVTPTIVFGELNRSISERTSRIKDAFDRAEINSRISEDIDADIWKKFISICVSGLLAVTKTTYGELRELKETRQMMIDLLNEVYALSQKIGIKIDPDFIQKNIDFIDSHSYNSTSSLTRDVWEGKPSELFYQNGTVVKLGEKYGIETPVNRFVFNTILPSELKARKG